MKINYSLLSLLLLIVMIPVSSFAHVILISPKGGEHFYPETKLLIKWEASQDHGANNWDLYYSLNNGKDRIEIVSDLTKGTTEYSWDIPKTESDSVRIIVIQDNEIGTDYEDISGSFIVSFNLPDPKPELEVITGFGDETDINENRIRLLNFPNPFYTSTTIQFYIPADSHVNLAVLNIQGQIIYTESDKILSEGKHQFVWKNDGFPYGIYVCRIQVAGKQIFHKMIISQ